jgi:hypothetical protein
MDCNKITHTIMHINILEKNIHQFMQINIHKTQKQISTEQKQTKNKRVHVFKQKIKI